MDLIHRSKDKMYKKNGVQNIVRNRSKDVIILSREYTVNI